MQLALCTHMLPSRDHAQSAPSSPRFPEQGTEAKRWGEDLDPSPRLHSPFWALSCGGKGSTITLKTKLEPNTRSAEEGGSQPRAPTPALPCQSQAQAVLGARQGLLTAPSPLPPAELSAWDWNSICHWLPKEAGAEN